MQSSYDDSEPRNVLNNSAHYYAYDHTGNRILKANMFFGNVGVNSNQTLSVPMAAPTLYVNPYFICSHYEEVVLSSKHYYMGAQRIASNLISEAFDHDDPNLELIEGPEGKFGYTNPQSAIVQDIYSTLECLSGEELTINYGDMLYLPSIGAPVSFTDDEGADVPAEELPSWLACEQSLYWSGQAGVNCTGLELMYWYHPDYLGSVEFVTDMRGEAYQFFLNTPWGENIENQFARNYTAFSSRFRFNGKEWDEETGNFYYGARYYDPKISVWLSVDPLAAKFPSISPYNYVENSPLMLIDPTGMGPETYEIDKEGRTSFVDNQKYYRNNETGEVGGENCENCSEVDKVIGVNRDGEEASIYVSKALMKTKRSEIVSYRNAINYEKSSELDVYNLTSKEEAQDFLEFTWEVTEVEFDYNFYRKDGFIDNHIVTTIGDGGTSLGKSVIPKDNTELIYSLHTHPGGDWRPSGYNDPNGSSDMKTARKYRDALFQIYSGPVNGYTTYGAFVEPKKDVRR